MPVFELEHEGKTYEVDAPDINSAVSAFAPSGGKVPNAPSYSNPSPQKAGGLITNYAAGTLEGLTGLPETIGSVGDFLFGLDRPELENSPSLRKAGAAVTGVLNKGLGLVDLNPESVEAKTPAERIARFTGGAMTGSLLPGGPESTIFQSLRSGATFGLSGGVAQELVPDWLKPYAAMVGGLLGNAGVEGTAAFSRGVKESPFAASVSSRAANRIAGKAVTQRASDIDKVRSSLDQSGEIVPGSVPTTFQQTGDLGLGELERQVRTKSPAAFTERAQDQNIARRSAFEGVQAPGQGNQNDLAQFFRDKLEDFDQQTAKETHDLLTDAQAKAAKTGGLRTPEAMGDDLRKITLKAAENAKKRENELWSKVPRDETGNVTATIDSAKEIRAEAEKYKADLDGDEANLIRRAETLKPVEKLGTLMQLRSDVSDAMRTELSNNGSSQKYRRLTLLRKGIGDNISNSLGDIYTGSLRSPANSEAANLLRDIPKQDATQAARDFFESESPVPKSESLMDVIRSKGGIKVADNNGRMTKEGQEVTNILRRTARPGTINKGGITPDALREHLQERGYLQDRPNGGEDLQDLYDALADEASGKKVYHPEDDIIERIRARDDLDQELHEAGIKSTDDRALKIAKLAKHRAVRNAAQAAEEEIPGFERLPEQRAAPQKPASIIKPTYRPETEQAINEASAKTKENARTFERGPVGDILARAGMQDLFKRPESRVPEKFFHPGPSGYQDMQKLYQAVGQPNAEAVVSDYAASSLRKAAMKDDGTLDPAKFARWKKAHSESLRALPDNIKSQFEDAGTAAQTLMDVTQTREAMAKEAQAGAIGRVMNASAPEDVTKTVGGIFGSKTAVGDMRQLANQARSDPQALQGLRQAVADHMAKLIGNTEVGTSGVSGIKSDQFQTFIKNNRATLAQVFSPTEIANLGKIAADLKRANRSISGVKIPGQSNTAQDVYELGRGHQPSRVTLIYDFLAERIGSHFGGLGIGLVAGGIAHLSQTLYNVGVRNIDQVITKAMLDPSFAKELLKPVPKTAAQQESFRRAMLRAFSTASKTTLVNASRSP